MPKCEKNNSTNIRYLLILNHLNNFNSKFMPSREQITNFTFIYQVNDKGERCYFISRKIYFTSEKNITINKYSNSKKD